MKTETWLRTREMSDGFMMGGGMKSSRVECIDGSRFVISASNYSLQLGGALMLDVY